MITMTEYEFTKTDEIKGFRIIFETEDFEFLEFMDKEIDKLIKQFYKSENNEM